MVFNILFDLRTLLEDDKNKSRTFDEAEGSKPSFSIFNVVRNEEQFRFLCDHMRQRLRTISKHRATFKKMISHVKREESCYLWTKRGIKYQSNKKRWYVHRLMFSLCIADIDRKTLIQQVCKKQRCVNPLHLLRRTGSTRIPRSVIIQIKNSKYCEGDWICYSSYQRAKKYNVSRRYLRSIDSGKGRKEVQKLKYRDSQDGYRPQITIGDIDTALRTLLDSIIPKERYGPIKKHTACAHERVGSCWNIPSSKEFHILENPKQPIEISKSYQSGYKYIFLRNLKIRVRDLLHSYNHSVDKNDELEDVKDKPAFYEKDWFCRYDHWVKRMCRGPECFNPWHLFRHHKFTYDIIFGLK